MPLALRSTTTTHNSTPFTPSERNLARQVLTLLLPLADVLLTKPEAVSREVTIVYEVLEPSINNKSVDTLARATFRQVIVDRTQDGKVFNADHPKIRDAASIRLLFRAACAEVGASCMTDDIFPKYGTKKEA